MTFDCGVDDDVGGEFDARCAVGGWVNTMLERANSSWRDSGITASDLFHSIRAHILNGMLNIVRTCR